MRKASKYCVRPRFPTPQGQSLEAWLNTYGLAVASLPLAPTILVGHSLGAALALRLVERAVEPFDGLFLAAAFIGSLGLPFPQLRDAILTERASTRS
jgi:uncharacterized protein